MKKLLWGVLLACALLLPVHAAPALAAVPPNDDFDNATVVTSLPFAETVDVSEATRAADDPYTSGWPNIWYRFTPGRDTSLELDTTGSLTSTDVCVYQGARGALGQVACSPDGPDSHFFAELKADVTYYVMVDLTSTWGAQTLTLALRDRTVANDDFDAAQTVDALPFSDSREVLRATSAVDDPWCLQSATNTVWYRYTPSADMAVVADTAGSDYDTRLCVFYGSRGALEEVASNDDTSGSFFAALTVNLQAGRTFWFMVATNQPGASRLHFSLQETSPLPSVANDDFDAATQISAAPFTDSLDASGATAAFDDPNDCFGTHGSVWYAYTPSVTGTLDVSTAGSDYDTAVGVYEGGRGSLSQVGCENDSDPMLTSHVSFHATAGTTYYVMVVAAWSLTPRTLQLSVDLTPSLPPLKLALTYDSAAVVDERAGTATVTGSMTCNRSARTTITATLAQELGNSAPRTGTGKTVVTCSQKTASTPFSIAISSTSSPGLSDGLAAMRLLATGCDSFGCSKAVANGDVQLVKKLR